MLLAILNICSKDELDSEETKKTTADTDQRRQRIKNKIMVLGKMSRTFSVLRENSELVMELKNLSGTGKLPTGTLGLGSEGIRKGKGEKRYGFYFIYNCFPLAITTFEDARRSDIENERLPPTSRESIEAIYQQTTVSKLRDVISEQDDALTHVANIIAFDSRSSRSQI
jgi:serine/threonine-protein phosphatase 2B catalytic subunit